MKSRDRSQRIRARALVASFAASAALAGGAQALVPASAAALVTGQSECSGWDYFYVACENAGTGAAPGQDGYLGGGWGDPGPVVPPVNPGELGAPGDPGPGTWPDLQDPKQTIRNWGNDHPKLPGQGYGRWDLWSLKITYHKCKKLSEKAMWNRKPRKNVLFTLLDLIGLGDQLSSEELAEVKEDWREKGCSLVYDDDITRYFINVGDDVVPLPEPSEPVLGPNEG